MHVRPLAALSERLLEHRAMFFPTLSQYLLPIHPIIEAGELH